MWLSRLTPRPEARRDPAFWRLLESPYKVHQEIWRLFSESPEQDRDFLFRQDGTAEDPVLFTLAPRVPVESNGRWKVEAKPFAPALAPGTRLAFTLRANPTVKRDGRRHDLVIDAKKKLAAQGVPKEEWPPIGELIQSAGDAWLRTRGEAMGFALESVLVSGYRQAHFPKRDRDVCLTTLDFAGVLQVLEPELFLARVSAGLGPAKGFGCGLMMLRRG